MNNYIVLIITFALTLIFLRSMDFIAQRGWLESKLSRKVIHIGTGPLFVLWHRRYCGPPHPVSKTSMES